MSNDKRRRGFVRPQAATASPHVVGNDRAWDQARRAFEAAERAYEAAEDHDGSTGSEVAAQEAFRAYQAARDQLISTPALNGAALSYKVAVVADHVGLTNRKDHDLRNPDNFARVAVEGTEGGKAALVLAADAMVLDRPASPRARLTWESVTVVLAAAMAGVAGQEFGERFRRLAEEKRAAGMEASEFVDFWIAALEADQSFSMSPEWAEFERGLRFVAPSADAARAVTIRAARAGLDPATFGGVVFQTTERPSTFMVVFGDWPNGEHVLVEADRVLRYRPEGDPMPAPAVPNADSGTAEDPRLIDAERIWDALEEEDAKLSGQHPYDDAAGERVTAARQRPADAVITVPARTTVGLAIKAKIAAHWQPAHGFVEFDDLEWQLHRAVVLDACRLGGRPPPAALVPLNADDQRGEGGQ